MAKLRLHLQDPACIPGEIAAVLASFRSRFEGPSDTSDVLSHPDLRAAAGALETHLRSQLILGYHCSKEPEPGYYAAHGLRVLIRQSHQAEFVTRFGGRFSDDEMSEMRAAWLGYFTKGQDIGRDGKVWLCLSQEQAKDGTDGFLTYYGGEAIYKPLHRDSTALAKLATIGHGVVVEAAIPGTEIEAFGPMTREVLSRYHANLNPNVAIFRLDGYVRRDILPSEITRVLAPGALD